ncbi:MAG: bifunctional folylpolyglutamate synthase/dihydrofolate synthase [Deltaproteobacteria bacterium]|nr:bifunctional folylpolyglutamate synthase/dihydrofolate synthase [Deltaproteobacteria bacterium]
MSAFQVLESLVPRGAVLDLGPVTAALAALGDPQASIPALHVAGTNGKGSACAMVAAALRAAGVRAGLYTSPHLHRFEERMRVDGEPADARLTERFALELRDLVARGEAPPLTFFEAATCVAWRVFAHHHARLAVLEVGLGGRLDATRVCAPWVTAITRIALDHQGYLGPDLVSIAREKAGIAREGVPLLLGPGITDPAVKDAIVRVARDANAPWREVPPPRVLGSDGAGHHTLATSYLGRAFTVRLGLAGAHQCDNAAVAVAVLEEAARRGLPITPEAVEDGLSSVRWPGRLERVADALLDGAHNLDGVDALLRALPTVLPEGPSSLVFGASSDKPWRAMLDLLQRAVPSERWVLAQAELSRAVAPETLAAPFGAAWAPTVAAALESARAHGGITLVCGSLHLVAAARAHLLKLTEDPRVGL